MYVREQQHFLALLFFTDSPSGSNLEHHVLYVHFPSTFETLYKEFYIYDGNAIISAVGGALGLFLGFSCLSLLLSGIDVMETKFA